MVQDYTVATTFDALGLISTLRFLKGLALQCVYSDGVTPSGKTQGRFVSVQDASTPLLSSGASPT